MTGGEDLETEATELLRVLIKNASVQDGMPASGDEARRPSDSPSNGHVSPGYEVRHPLYRPGRTMGVRRPAPHGT